MLVDSEILSKLTFVIVYVCYKVYNFTSNVMKCATQF